MTDVRTRPNLTITGLETLLVDDGGPLLLVAVSTDAGITGVGEVGLRPRYLAVRGALEHLEPLLVGSDPFRTEHLWQTMSRSGFYPADRVLGSALSAVDIALWDIKGKALGVPVYELLGGAVRDSVLCYRHITGEDAAELLDAAQRARDEGWSVVRLELPAHGEVFEPRPAVREGVAVLTALRGALGDEVELIVDVHTRLDLADATTLCRELEPLGMYFVEDPLRWEDPALYETLRARTHVPLAAGEQAASKWELRQLVERDLIDYARFDVCIVGGLTEAKKIAGWCETHHLRTATHNPLGPVATAASLHLNLTLPAFGIQEQYQVPGTRATDVFPVQMTMSGGSMLPPSAPGLGLEVDLDAARAHRLDLRPFPRLRRADGAVTNW